MKDLDKNQTDAVNVSEPELKFDLDEALVDEPVMERDYFTFNIQDIIKAVNEHEDVTDTPAEDSEPGESVPEPESKSESELEFEIESESEPEPESGPGEQAPEIVPGESDAGIDAIPEPTEPEPETVIDLEPESEFKTDLPAEEPESGTEGVAGSELRPQETNDQASGQNQQPTLKKPALGSDVATNKQDFNQNQQPVLENNVPGSDSAELESVPEIEAEPEPEIEPEVDSESEPKDTEESAEPDLIRENPAPKPVSKSNRKLMITVIILLVIVAASIAGGLAAANSLVDKANAAKEEKIAAVQENIKEVDLTESLREYAADEVLEDIKVPTYTLEQLYALDLREKTGFTEEDLKIITTRGLVGCEEAFVKAEETYGVNSIFLISIASLESAYGTQMFRPNNMFGYGRTGFSSKSECIMTVAKGLGTRYLQPGASLYGGSPTLKGVNKRYAANPQWYYKVGKYMQRYYNELAAAKNGNVEKFE